MSEYGQHHDKIKKLGDERFVGNDVKVAPLSSMHTDLGSLAEVRSGTLSPHDLDFILPDNRTELASRLDIKRKNAYNLNDAQDRREFRELLKKAANATIDGEGGMQAWNELSAYRRFEFDMDIMASPWVLSAFKIIPLDDEDLPLITTPRSRTLQRFAVTSVSLDGQSTRDQWISAKSIEQITMDYLSTPRVRYRLRDLQTGSINDYADIQRELQYDMDMKLDALAKVNLDAIGMTSGLRALMNIDSRIVTANVPDANKLDLSGANAGILTLDKLKQILAHILMFGFAGGALEPFKISNIQISPQNIDNMWDFVSLVSGISGGAEGEVDPKNTVPASVREQIFNTGTMTTAWGQRFSLTPNPQLAKGKMYVFTNRPVGWMFTKPGMDQVLNWDERVSPDYAEKNYGETLYRKATKIYMPDAWRQHVLIVDL